jgi:hypothetical protein
MLLKGSGPTQLFLFFPQLRILVVQSTIQVVQYLELSAVTLWEFDRLGSIASKSFDINKDGLQFVSAILGYLLASKEQLGFDPTIIELEGKRYIDIVRNDQRERVFLSELIRRAPCVAGGRRLAGRRFARETNQRYPWSSKTRGNILNVKKASCCARQQFKCWT